MAINLVHRKDLNDRVERLAGRLGLTDRGRKTAIIKRALTVLEEQVAHTRPRRADIEASLNRYIRDGRDLRTRCGDGSGRPLSEPAGSARRRSGPADVIVLGTSAILAILQPEDEASAFRNLITESDGALVSAGNAVELTAVASGRDDLFDTAREFLKEPYIAIEPVDAEQADIAAKAYRRYGKGPHPAGLNLGDTFAYAIAHRRGVPLLFKGDDFVQTDVESAVGPRSA